jgi:hypothetical protein
MLDLIVVQYKLKGLFILSYFAWMISELKW